VVLAPVAGVRNANAVALQVAGRPKRAPPLTDDKEAGLRRSLSSGRALRGPVGLTRPAALSATSARNRKVYAAGE
jgi:hypothetical protein